MTSPLHSRSLSNRRLTEPPSRLTRHGTVAGKRSIHAVFGIALRNRDVLKAVRNLVGKGKLQLVTSVPRQYILQHLRICAMWRVRYGRSAVATKFKQAWFHEGGRLENGQQLGGVHG